MGYSTQQEKVLVADPNFVPSLAERLATINQKDQLGPDDCVLIEGEWLHTLLSQVSDYIFIKDAHCRFVMANQQVCLDVGYENTEDIIGKTDLELHSPEIGRVIWEGEKTLLRFKKPIIDLAEMLVLPDGSRKWFSTSKYPILDCNGAVAGLIGIARDMTERRRSEYLHIGQNQILQMIATGTTLDSILTSLVGVFEDQLVSTVCAVMLVDEMEQLQWAAGPNLPDSLRVAADGVEVGPDTVSMGQALHLRKTVFSDDMTQEQGWRADIKPVLESGLRSNLTVPFFAKDGSALGVFTLFSSKSEPPSEHRRGLAEEAARLAAIAVERDQAKKRIRYLAHHDVLTGLLNRQEFKTRLEESISQSQITSESVAIIFVDVDKFKSINDTFGHAAGDHVLRTIANRIKAQCHDNCQAIRYGGDEFVIMIRGEGAEKSNLPVFMESLRRAMTEKVHFQGLSFPVTCSIGGASYPEDAGCPTDLLKAADTAVFNAKSSGRDCYVLYEHRRSKHSSGEENLIDDMRHGLEAEHFFLEYQPQYALETGQISGVEALLRWDHPKFGRMMPGQFLGLAEESRLIVPLGLWAVEEACRQGRAWQDKGIVPITIAVNISDRQAQSHTFVKDISAALEASSFAAEFLELEFKESLLDQDKVFASRILCELKAMGVRLAIDDFGTGNSLLALIKDFTFDRLKLDRSFVSALEDQKADRTLFRVIASMGRELEFDVVAEGVETAEQLEFLKNCHCKAAQGFYLGHPQRADALQALLEVTP